MEVEKFNKFILVATRMPGLFLINKIEDIFFVCIGYINALQDTDEFDVIFKHINIEYRAFMNKRIKVGYDCDWHRLIRLMSSSDKHSLEIFESSYTAFLKSKKMKVPK
jgi:hypothetical protein